MDFKVATETINIIFQFAWWLITTFPGIIIPSIIAGVLATVFHWKRNTQDLAESILELFF